MKQLSASWEHRALELATVPDAVLAPSDKKRTLSAIDAIASGQSLHEIATAGGMMKGEIGVVCAISPIIRSLFDQARAIRDYSRQLEREDKAHELSVVGVEKEVFSASGALLAKQVEYSPDLMKFMMKAAEPEKYGDKNTLSVQSGVVLQVNMGLRDNAPQTNPIIEVTNDDSDEPGHDTRIRHAPAAPQPARAPGDATPEPPLR